MAIDKTNTWQNNLTRVALLLTIAGTAIVVVFILFVAFNSDVGSPGAIAKPVLLGCLIGVLILLTGFAIERETVRKRLPYVRVINIVITLLVVVLCFGVKSFFFGAGIYLVMLMSVFLVRTEAYFRCVRTHREFDARLRGVAVCGTLICLTIAEAMRRAGSYDSGGMARWIQNAYSFFAFVLPGLVVMSTWRKFPKVTLTCCVSFGVLAMHSGIVMLAGAATILDNAFEGKASSVKNERGYCIVSNINSPVGALVEAFQDAVFPAYDPTTTVTTTPPINTTSTTRTTTFDCRRIGEILTEEENYTWTNGTNESENGIEYIDSTRVKAYAVDFSGVDVSHCVGVDASAFLDPNTTTTATTSTTVTSTTSTTSTSTTLTTTTSTSTTSTSTTTTTSSTSTTSTSTTSTTTTGNETTGSTTTALNITAPPEYVRLEKGEYCSVGTDLIVERQCREATKELGLVYGNPFAGAGEHRGCFYADDNRRKVYFNYAKSPAPDPNMNYASICYRVPPYDLTRRCEPGMDETAVSDSGYWAIVVYGLAGLWVLGVTWSVLLFLRQHAHHFQKVHPETDVEQHHEHGEALKYDGHGEQELQAAMQDGIKVEGFCERRQVVKYGKDHGHTIVDHFFEYSYIDYKKKDIVRLLQELFGLAWQDEITVQDATGQDLDDEELQELHKLVSRGCCQKCCACLGRCCRNWAKCCRNMRRCFRQCIRRRICCCCYRRCIPCCCCYRPRKEAGAGANERKRRRRRCCCCRRRQVDEPDSNVAVPEPAPEPAPARGRRRCCCCCRRRQADVVVPETAPEPAPAHGRRRCCCCRRRRQAGVVVPETALAGLESPHDDPEGGQTEHDAIHDTNVSYEAYEKAEVQGVDRFPLIVLPKKATVIEVPSQEGMQKVPTMQVIPQNFRLARKEDVELDPEAVARLLDELDLVKLADDGFGPQSIGGSGHNNEISSKCPDDGFVEQLIVKAQFETQNTKHSLVKNVREHLEEELLRYGVNAEEFAGICVVRDYKDEKVKSDIDHLPKSSSHFRVLLREWYTGKLRPRRSSGSLSHARYVVKLDVDESVRAADEVNVIGKASCCRRCCKCLKRWCCGRRMRRCCGCIFAKTCGRCCKCKFSSAYWKRMFKTLRDILMEAVEAVVGIAFFTVYLIVLVIVGGTQLPQDQPSCARDPVYSPLALADEPALRFSIVWCELGVMASVCFAFLSYCNFTLLWSMLLRKVVKYRIEERMKATKRRLQEQRDYAIKTGGVIDDEDQGTSHGFQLRTLNPADQLPPPIWQDYDGRVFDC